MRNSDSRIRAVTTAVLGLRVAYGVGLIAAPDRVGKRWIGPVARSGPAQIGLQGVGGREIGLHVAALYAAARGAPLRPWLAASIVGDLSDVLATVAKRSELTNRATGATVLVGGGSGVISAVLLAALEH